MALQVDLGTVTFQVDENLHWTDHYVRYGFAVVRGLVESDYCRAALAEVRRVVGDDRPVTMWEKRDGDSLNDPHARPGQWHYPFFQDPGRTGVTPQNRVLETLYDLPRLRAAIDDLFGDSDAWDGVRNYYIFLNPYTPAGMAHLEPTGHIDFKVPTPILYRGFTFQIALLDTEPRSGNTTIYPGTHIPVQKMLMENPDRKVTFQDEVGINRVEPYEFVAEAGDVLFMHHLVYHAGNPSHAPNRKPRLGIHAEAFRARWLTEVGSEGLAQGPWQRSLSLNGPWRVDRDEARPQRQARAHYITEIEKEQGVIVEEKWKRYSDWPEPGRQESSIDASKPV